MTGLRQLQMAPVPFEVWQVDLSGRPSETELLGLSAEERRCAERFVFARDRDRYLTAHCALRTLLSSRTGRPSHALRFRYGPFGKPYLRGSGACAFNLSHSQDTALIALADAGEIGVDVEVLREVPEATELAKSHYTAVEQAMLQNGDKRNRDLAFLLGWTRKEACLKAIGSGLSIEPNSFEVGLVQQARMVRIVTPGGTVRVGVQSFVHRSSTVVSLARLL